MIIIQFYLFNIYLALAVKLNRIVIGTVKLLFNSPKTLLIIFLNIFESGSSRNGDNFFPPKNKLSL